jgi:hypothetical protein
MDVISWTKDLYHFLPASRMIGANGRAVAGPAGGQPTPCARNSIKEWLGRSFDPEAFDAARANEYRRMLKWPRVTEAHRRRVLMKWDNFHE